MKYSYFKWKGIQALDMMDMMSRSFWFLPELFSCQRCISPIPHPLSTEIEFWIGNCSQPWSTQLNLRTISMFFSDSHLKPTQHFFGHSTFTYPWSGVCLFSQTCVVWRRIPLKKVDEFVWRMIRNKTLHLISPYSWSGFQIEFVLLNLYGIFLLSSLCSTDT